MVKHTALLTFTAVFFLLIIAGCKKDPLSRLPGATQTGADTFGCLVDGMAFYPKAPLFSFGTTLSVEFGQRNFHVHALMKVDKKTVYYYFTVDLATDSISLKQGMTYPLGSISKDKFIGKYSLAKEYPDEKDYQTGDSYKGRLTVTKIDSIKRFISGTFSFDASTNQGETAHVTDGRFDLKY